MEEEQGGGSGVAEMTNMYSIWAVPPEDVSVRIKKVMEILRGEYGGPEYEPHITVAGATRLTEKEAVERFKSACEGLKPYPVNVSCVATGDHIYLHFHPSIEMEEASSHSSKHFGYVTLNPYIPHMSLTYKDLTEEEKYNAKVEIEAFDTGVRSLSFTISHLALYETESQIETWKKITDYHLY